MATVTFSSWMRTFSLASTAWCRPSDQRRPSMMRPVNSSTILTSPSITTYSSSRLYSSLALIAWIRWLTSWPFSGAYRLSTPSAFSILSTPDSVGDAVWNFSSTS